MTSNNTNKPKIEKIINMYSGGSLQFGQFGLISALQEISFWQRNVEDCYWLHTLTDIKNTVRATECGVLLIGTRPATEYVAGQPRPPRGITLIWKSREVTNEAQS